MSKPAPLRKLLAQFKEVQEKRQKERRLERVEKRRQEDERARNQYQITLSQDVKALFEQIMQAVIQETQRYVPVTVDNARTGNNEVATAPVTANAKLADTIVPSIHLRPLWDAWLAQKSLWNIEPTDSLTPEEQLCAGLLRQELSAVLDENAQKAVISVPLLHKLRQAVQAFADKRHNDTVTLMKTALHGDPHNHIILALLSQVLYFMAARGIQTVLPEAREHAQRSTIYTDKVKPERLLFYRYLAMVTERNFGPERTIEWLRETGILDAASMQSKAGLMSGNGIYLRAWALLATVPVNLWQETEFKALHRVMERVVGGAAMYLAWFREPLLLASSTSKTPIAAVDELELLLHSARVLYEDQADALRKLPLSNIKQPWILRVRYLHALVAVAPVPNFDQMLTQIALDGQSCTENVSPDPELRALLDYNDLNYWKIWMYVVTPMKDVRQPYLLPGDETWRDGDLLGVCEEMLVSLQQAEKDRIKQKSWPELKAWLVRWKLDHLLAAGSGSSQPRTRFAPTLAPYTGFYRQWQTPLISGLLSSEVILETAKRGGFSSFFEVTAAFSGALRIIDDPVHGLAAVQKRAFAAAMKANPKKFKEFESEFGRTPTTGIFMLILPVGALGLIWGVISYSANWSQAMGLILALLGVAGFVLANMGKR